MSTQPAVAELSHPPLTKTTLRQRLLVQGVAEGKSLSEAGQDAGYRSIQNAADSFSALRDRLAGVMDNVGLTEQAIAERLRDQMYATRTVVATAFGAITDSMEVADNQAIGKAIETAAKIRRMIGGDGGNVGIGTVNILWAGPTPAWCGHTEAQVDTTVTQRCGQANVDTDAQANVIVTQPLLSGEGVPEVQLKVLEPGLPPHHTSAGSKSDSKNVLTQRVVKRRKPRLPVYKGAK